MRSRSHSRSPHHNNDDSGVLNLDTKAAKVPPPATTDDEEATASEKFSPKPLLESTELRSRLEEAFHNSVVVEHVAGGGSSNSLRRSKKFDSTEDLQMRPAHMEENGYDKGLDVHPSSDLHSRSRKLNHHHHKDDLAIDQYAAAAAAHVAKEKLSLVPKSIEPINLFKNNFPISGLDPVSLPFPLSLPRPTADFPAGIYPRPTDFMHYLFPYPPLGLPYPTHRIYPEESSSYRKELPKEPRPPSPSSRTSPPKVTALYHHPARVDPTSHSHQSSVASIH